MHYKDGTLAAIGDLVRGRGYNLKHEVQGVVVGLTAGAGSCNIHVATLRYTRPSGDLGLPYLATYEEHGTCAEFELVYRDPSLTPKPDAELARAAFEAYGQSTGGKTWDGKDIPPFEVVAERTPHVARAWEAAVAAVRKLLGR